MSYVDQPEAHTAWIHSCFSEALGKRLLMCETAELQQEDGLWKPWSDLPIRLSIGSDEPTAIAWSHFSRLWIERGTALPFSIETYAVRWVENTIPGVSQLLGSELRSVFLGRGEMSIEGRDIEIWTRLLLVFEAGCLEIYNALDENGYALHSEQPSGDFIKCV